jgi:TPR repeat protein
MALNAVGQHYLRNDFGQQNLTLAREFFSKAADLSSADGHFSLAMMWREGSAGRVDVPLCVLHLAHAIQLGHVRASNFLAHGLLDPEGWFYQFGREAELGAWMDDAGVGAAMGERLVDSAARGDVRAVHDLLSAGANASHVSTRGGGATALEAAARVGSVPVVKALLSLPASAGPGAEARARGRLGVDVMQRALLQAQAHFHHSVVDLLTAALAPAPASSSASPLFGDAGAGAWAEGEGEGAGQASSWVYNSSQQIVLTLPHGSFPLPTPLARGGGTCSAALQLLKHIAEHSYRTNDLNKAALAAYVANPPRPWDALALYDEAASLGLQSAQENAAFLHEELGAAECGKDGLVALSLQEATRRVHSLLQSLAERSGGGGSSSSSSSSPSSASFPGESRGGGRVLPGLGSEERCRFFFDKLAARRWMQLANTGDYLARREVAEIYARPTRPPVTKAAVQPNKTHAALLYALAAEQGDVHSMVHLAWLLHEGGDGLVKNNSAARALFLTAADSEFRDESAGGPLNTNGVASQIGLLVLAWDDTVMWVRSLDPILLENAAIFFLLCLLSILYWSRRILAAVRAGGVRRPRPRPFLLHPEPR